ncbi:MAG: NAD-dependent epimerase/dehydratase family protein [Candidatus Aminicenantes bacterium]|nr:NAD-dependent epimerase/dehydratase family protein [Candidatus Aminicenantes bacterium]
MNLLVTGATGFVGSVLLPRLIERYGVRSVSAYVLPGDRIPDSWAGQGVRIFEGDIADPAAVRKAVVGMSHIVHLAGLISYWRGDRERLFRVNRDGARIVAEACLDAAVERLIHMSSVGAIGFHKDGRPADEETPYNWPDSILYMASKHAGQLAVEELVRSRGLRAVIFNPASIMGPGDHAPDTPHNKLYGMIPKSRFMGSFSGGLAIVDVRDLTALVEAALEGKGRDGERYLAVGANLTYSETIRLIGRACGRNTRPIAIPSGLVAAGGGLVEGVSAFFGKRPLITFAYGRLSGWRSYYDNAKSVREFEHAYLPVERTIADGWEYFRNRHQKG